MLPRPGAPVGFSIGLMRRILPLRSFVLADGALRVPRLAAEALVDRVEAGRVERVRVVARGDVEAAVGAEVQRAGRVAALATLVLEGQDALLGREVERVAVDLEARDHLRVRAVGQLRVEEVDPVAGGEIRSELQAEQAVLLAVRDGDGARGHGLTRARLPDHQAPVALDVEDATVRSDVELHRVRRVVVERDFLEIAGSRLLCSGGARPAKAQHDRGDRSGDRPR